MEQIEEALIDLANMAVEQFAMRGLGSITGAIPGSSAYPPFSLE